MPPLAVEARDMHSPPPIVGVLVVIVAVLTVVDIYYRLDRHGDCDAPPSPVPSLISYTGPGGPDPREPSGTWLPWTSMETYLLNTVDSCSIRMTVDGTTGSSGDLRADGKRIALSHGMGTITTMNHDGGDPADLSAGDSPRWSPDGEWIVFTRAADVFVMRSDGTEQQRLTDNDVVDVGPDWSPDGTRIVFAQGTRVGGSPTDDMDLYVINRDGTGLTRLTDLIGLVVDPAWSPDGTQIAFASNFPYDWDIYLINSDGTDLRQLTDDPHYNRNPVWSPDGSKIAFFSSIGEPVNDWVNGTYIVNRDGSNRVHWEVLGPVAMLTSWISN